MALIVINDSGNDSNTKCRVAIVPLFGNLTETKIQIIESKILMAAYHSSHGTILFDFTAVGGMKDGGIHSAWQLLQSLSLMGIQVWITGIKPEQAIEMNRHSWLSTASHVSSVNEALRKNLN